MGMDIYLEDKKLKEKTEKARQKMRYYAKRRDAEKDEAEKAKLQQKVDQWLEIQCSPEAGYFRVSYHDQSLSFWLMHNIDPKAKGEWGVYSKIKGSGGNCVELKPASAQHRRANDLFA